jgi:hypothetical protein
MWRRKPQRPPPTYENVRLVAGVLSRINPDLIERHFAVSAETAQNFLFRLVAERRFGDLQPDGWHYPPIRKLRLRRSRGMRPISTSKSKIGESTPNETASVDDLTQHIDELERESYALRSQVKRLQDAGKTVIGQREQWKARALAAEEQLGSERSRRCKGDDRFDALRRLVAKELHPDYCNGGALEKLKRQECFKKLWPEIVRLAEHG